MSEVHVETVAHEAAEEAAEISAEAQATETAAEAAVALANSQAASAELDAAERVRDYAQELDECRSEIASLAENISASLNADAAWESLLRESIESLSRENVSLADRLAAMESRLPSIPEASENQGENPGPTLAGAEGAAQVGPIEATAGASLGGSEATSETPNHGSRRVRRKWI
jgi:hypothetical protein